MCNLYKDLNAVDEIKIRRLGWVGHVVRMYAERIPPPKPKKRILAGNFVTKDQWENQEQAGPTSSGGTHHRFSEYEDGGDEQKTEKNGGVC
jgi:hypothetical protein